MGKMIDKVQQLKDKNSVVRFEFDNRSHIILFRSGREFWNATMNSALFMKYILESSAKFHTVKDYYFNENRIYLAYHDKQKLAIINRVKRESYEVLRDDKDIIVIKLKQAVEVDQVKKWRHSEEVIKDKINSLFKPRHGSSEIYVHLRRLGGEVINANHKMMGDQRQIIGNRLMEIILSCYDLQNKIAVNHGAKEEAIAKQELRKQLDRFSFLSSVAGDESAIDNKRMLRMGDLLLKLNQLLGGGRLNDFWSVMAKPFAASSIFICPQEQALNS